MFGAFLFGSDIYSSIPVVLAPGVYVLLETITATDDTLVPEVTFVLNDFVFSSDLTNNAPDASLGERLHLNDWVWVEKKQSDTQFHD